MPASGYAWGVGRSQHGDLVLGEIVQRPSGPPKPDGGSDGRGGGPQDGQGVQGNEGDQGAPRTTAEVLRGLERERARELTEAVLAAADPCHGLESAPDLWLIERRVPTPVVLHGLAVMAMQAQSALTLRAGQSEAIGYRPLEPGGKQAVQCLRIRLWPGPVVLAALRPAGQPLYEDAWYMPAFEGKPPSVIVGRGQMRPGETATLRLVEGTFPVRFGALMAQGPDYWRLELGRSEPGRPETGRPETGRSER
jgi:hypothetical protein